MLVYDNRGRWRLILQLYGSIYRRVWVAALLVSLYSVALHILFWKLRPDLRPNMDHPFAAQSLSVLIAFSVCFRTNIAWNRFWESCQEVTFMYSKWCDAFSQLQGFITSTVKQRGVEMSDEERAKLEHARVEVTHYFSLLSCMAVERLMRGDIRRMQLRRQHGASWSDQVVFREHLRFHDLTGSKELCTMRPIKLEELMGSECDQEAVESLTDLVGRNDEGRRRRRSVAAARDKLHRLGKTESAVKSATLFTGSGTFGLKGDRDDEWQAPLPVIGELSKEELVRLRKSEDRISLVIYWINSLVTDLVPHLVVPAPIMSRVYQEVSNGALGYSQAEKLSDIPFPFIFAQILAVAILVVAAVSPVAFTIITGDASLTPLISTVVVLSFWSLNEMAKELENPFGVEANNVPIVDHHERFVQMMGEIHGAQLPSDREYVQHHWRRRPRPPAAEPAAAAAAERPRAGAAPGKAAEYDHGERGEWTGANFSYTPDDPKVCAPPQAVPLAEQPTPPRPDPGEFRPSPPTGVCPTTAWAGGRPPEAM